MSEYSDIAGSDDIISLNYDTQETFNETSFRVKQQAAIRTEKTSANEDCLKNPAKENQKPIEKVIDNDIEVMQTDTETNGVSHEQTSPLTDAQESLPLNNPFLIQPPVAQSTLTDDNSISAAQGSIDSLPIESQAQEEKNSVNIESTFNSKLDSNVFDTSTTASNLRLYISPSTSLLETTNVEDAQSNHGNNLTSEIEQIEKPKEEPMETTDAQASLGSDGIIESNPTPTNTDQPTPVMEIPTVETPSPKTKRVSFSPTSKALSSLSQPNLDKFDQILAKIVPSPTRQTGLTNGDKTDSNITIEEEEELVIKESITKSIRRYTVKTDSNGRTLSRDLLDERIVEENTTVRVECYPPSEKKVVRRSSGRPPSRTVEPPPKKAAPKRRTKSLKPAPTTAPSKTTKAVQSDKDESSDDNEKIETINEVNDDDSDDSDDADNLPTDNITGEELTPSAKKSSDQSVQKGARVFAKWIDGHFYPGIIGNINGEKYSIEFDDGAKRYVKSPEIILQDYLEPNQTVQAQSHNGRFDSAVVKRLIKKKKSKKLGYVVELDGKEKWFPLRFISLTQEQAENLPFLSKSTTESEGPVLPQRKRKRTSNVSQSPNKKTKSSSTTSPSKNQRTTFTPTRKTKLFNSMNFLFTGFNDSMDLRHKIADSIESHGGRVIEKIPNANRRENVYLISDTARRTLKFLEAKKANIPAANYKWIEESIDKSEVQDYESYQLVLPEKEAKKNRIEDDDED